MVGQASGDRLYRDRDPVPVQKLLRKPRARHAALRLHLRKLIEYTGDAALRDHGQDHHAEQKKQIYVILHTNPSF